MRAKTGSAVNGSVRSGGDDVRHENSEGYMVERSVSSEVCLSLLSVIVAMLMMLSD